MSPNDPNPNLAAAFNRVNELCQQFSLRWKKGERPAIEDYVTDVAEGARSMLFQNLLAVELAFRGQSNEQPTAGEYCDRFPDHADVVRQIFLNSLTGSTSHSNDPLHETGEIPLTESFRLPAANRLGKYEILRELGRGGFGVVFEAVHQDGGDPVALKVLLSRHGMKASPFEDADRLHKFRGEFRKVAEINHPNLVGLHNLEADGDQWFFTMDLVDGVDFLRYVRPQGALDEQRLRLAIHQLVAGVSALHAQYLVHRDLKPSNVIVDGRGRLVVLDFGLAAEVKHFHSIANSIHFAGTPIYAAPEQWDGNSSAASDWYAVGVMLYECLTGERPFSGGALEVMQQKQNEDPLPIVDIPASLADLAELCIKLLQREPHSRPRAAEIALITGGSSPEPPPEHPLIARESQLEQLAGGLQTMRTQNQPLTAFVSGKSGEGKSSLIDHFLEPLRNSQRYTVLAGRCYDRESVPFKALDSLIDALCSFLHSLSERDAAILLPDDVAILAQVFPVMRRVKVIEEKSAGVAVSGLDDQQMRQRAFNSLRLLLSRVSRKTPIIMFIDDLQWGDADSAEVVFQVLRPPEAPAVMFLGSFRSDEQDDSPFLQEWEALKNRHEVEILQHDVHVGPLNVEESAKLLVSELGQDTEIIRRRAKQIHEQTGGNAFLMLELISCFDPDTDSFEALPVHEVIDRKLANLPEGASELLDVIAVSGQALSISEASRAAGKTTPDRSTVLHMRNERLVRLIGSGQNPKVDTYHDRIRETVLDHLDNQASCSLHLRLAEAIEELSGGGVSDDAIVALKEGGEVDVESLPCMDRIYDLAYHYDAAGDKRKAWPCGLLAAEQARRQFALEVAVEQYAIAKRNLTMPTDATQFRIAKSFGEVLMLLGRYTEAESELAGAIDLTDDVLQKARMELLEGEVAFKRGEMTKSVAAYASGLNRLGVRVPRTLQGFALAVVRESAIQTLHTLLPGRLHKKTTSEQQKVVNQLFNRIAGPFGFTNIPKMLWALLAGMNRAELVPQSPELAYIYAFHAGTIVFLGMHSRAIKYAEKANEVRRDFNDIWGLGHSHTWYGIGLYSSARFEESIRSLRQAVDEFSQSGDLWELNMARFHLACCHYRLGNFAEAAENAAATYRTAVNIGDTRSHCSLFLWSRVVEGSLPFDRLEACFAKKPEDIMSTCNFLVGKGRWQLALHDYSSAVKNFEESWSLALRNINVNFHTVSSLTWLVTALRHRAEELAKLDPKASAAAQKRSLRLARRAAWLTRLYPCDHPHALREYSLALQAKGRTAKALRLIEKSCSIAERQEARYELAQSSMIRARLRKQLGKANREDDIKQAEEVLASFQAKIEAAKKWTLSNTT